MVVVVTAVSIARITTEISNTDIIITIGSLGAEAIATTTATMTVMVVAPTPGFGRTPEETKSANPS